MAAQMGVKTIESVVHSCMYSCKVFGLDLLECMERGFDTAMLNGADEKNADKMVTQIAVRLFPAPIETR
jgi:hypothetical protein